VKGSIIVLNIVAPTGIISQEVAPFTVLGNRGVIHEDDRIVKPFQLKRWIYCVTTALSDPCEFMRPGRTTELFFLDEATALAAGHRPCHSCNRKHYEEYFRLWAQVFGVDSPGAEEVDEVLHAERIDSSGIQVTFSAECASLPLGIMIRTADSPQPLRVAADCVYPWTNRGYGIKRKKPVGLVQVLTPKPTLELLRSGLSTGPETPLFAW
jgi:hypothetical protein